MKPCGIYFWVWFILLNIVIMTHSIAVSWGMSCVCFSWMWDIYILIYLYGVSYFLSFKHELCLINWLAHKKVLPSYTGDKIYVWLQ